MLKKISYFLIPLIILLMLSSCKKINNSSGFQPPKSGNRQNETSNSGTDIKDKNTDEINEHIQNMTLDEKIGQIVICGIDGFTNNEHSQELMEKYHVGGFILLSQNVENTNQTLSLINSLKRFNVNSHNTVPLFIGVDQEGGRIDRMPKEFKRLPTNKAIGIVNNSDFSYSIGRILGEEGKSFGFNLDFAPVLDINSNPNNPVIGDRSFGATTKVVTTLGVETMEGIHSEGIISAIKHFPGHGDTSIDSHTGLPVVNYTLTRLKSFELVPFAEAINNSADMVMVAHILFPKIDAQYPASMSKTIITDLLKNNMKFNGVIITDDMTMGAIIKKYDIGEAAVRSILAGSNIILVCHDFDKETAVINALKTAVENGTISTSSVDSSVYKILQLKQKYGIADKTVESIDVKSINGTISTVLNKYLK